MKTMEVFSGTKSFSKVAKELGHKTWTIDNNKELEPDFCCDVLIEPLIVSDGVDVLWCSPPCTAFSVAAIGKNWDKDTKQPKSDNAKLGLALLNRTVNIIKRNLDINPNMVWFIENPRGMMRKVIYEVFKEQGITDFERKTVTYCQYGDTRMKPTDVWTNLKGWTTRPMCKNGAKCHESAPRGSRTGTQGLKNAKDRGVIPPALFYEIFETIREE